MSSAFKCDICGEFFEYEPFTVLTKLGEWCVKDDGSVMIHRSCSLYDSESEMDFCETCSEEIAAFIFGKRVEKAET